MDSQWQEETEYPTRRPTVRETTTNSQRRPDLKRPTSQPTSIHQWRNRYTLDLFHRSFLEDSFSPEALIDYSNYGSEVGNKIRGYALRFSVPQPSSFCSINDIHPIASSITESTPDPTLPPISPSLRPEKRREEDEALDFDVDPCPLSVAVLVRSCLVAGLRFLLLCPAG